MKKAVASAAFAAVIVLFAQAVVAYAQLPIVFESATTGGCTLVVDFRGAESPNGCSNPPKKYVLAIVR